MARGNRRFAVLALLSLAGATWFMYGSSKDIGKGALLLLAHALVMHHSFCVHSGPRHTRDGRPRGEQRD